MSGYPPPPACPPPWVATNRAMTAKAGHNTYQQFIACGWTDPLLIEHGYMENPNMSFPSVPIAVDPPRPMKEIEADLTKRLKIAADANRVALDARADLTETRNELRSAAAYHLGQSEAVASGDVLP